MPIDPNSPADIAAFVRAQGTAVVSTVDPIGHPEAALVGVAMLDDGALIFDARHDSRKVENIRRDAHVAVVVGLTGAVSIQLEGAASIAAGDDRLTFGADYNAQLPGSRALDDEFAVIVIRPKWVRVYDTSVSPPRVEEAVWG